MGIKVSRLRDFEDLLLTAEIELDKLESEIYDMSIEFKPALSLLQSSFNSSIQANSLQSTQNHCKDP